MRIPRPDESAGKLLIYPHVFTPEPATVWEAAGFFVRRNVQTPNIPSLPRVTYTETVVAVPYWSLACLSAAAPAIRGIRFLRERRPVKANRCVRCGYDLTANAKCGTAATSSTAA